MLTLSTTRRRGLAALPLVTALAAGSFACTYHPRWPSPTTTTTTTGASTTSTTAAPTGNTVTFQLDNFTITRTAGMILPGENTITVTNVGTAPHEITFLRADSAASLPTLPNGAVDVSRISLADHLGTVRAAAGTSASSTVSFTPGSYVALCNVGAAGTNPHFIRGMFLDFSVI